MSEDFENLIKNEKANLNSLKSQMEEIKQEFILETSKFVNEWYDDKAKYYIEKENPENTISLGKEKIIEIKKKITYLKKKTEIIVKERLSDSSLWWHIDQKKELSSYVYHYYGNRAPEHLNKAIKFCLGELAPILEKFGYGVKTKVSGDRRNDFNVWREYNESGSYKLAEGRLYYPYSIDWSDSMRTIIEKYAKFLDQAEKINNRINDLEKRKRETQASDLWDSV